MNLAILPFDLQRDIENCIVNTTVLEERILEVPLAEILNKLYPEDFPYNTVYTLLLKYNNQDNRYNYVQNINSYERLYHFHPLFFTT
ncbi:MAG: hypothetical protein AB8U61_05985 [Rickettsiales endosymbiont of Dermacentor nuttalli]